MPLTIAEKLDSMKSLPPNWDSYGADPANPETIRVAAAFLTSFIDSFQLREPLLFPTPVGGVLAEWEIGPHGMEIEFAPGGAATHVSYVYENQDNGETLSGEFNLVSLNEAAPVALSAIAVAMHRASAHPMPLAV